MAQRFFDWKGKLFLITLNPKMNDISLKLYNVDWEGLELRLMKVFSKFEDVSIISEIGYKIRIPVQLKGFDGNRVFIPFNDGSDSCLGCIYDLEKNEKIEEFEIYRDELDKRF